MFDSPEAFRAGADDPLRMGFGYAKLAGLVLAMLATARFWWTRKNGGAWWDLRAIAWKRLSAGVALWGLVPSIPLLFNDQLGSAAAQGISFALSLALLPALFLLIAGLFGDRQTSRRALWRRSWPWALLAMLLLVLALTLPQWVHQKNHDWALGAPSAAVWVLMTFDALLVGLLAGLLGTALYLSYAAFLRHDSGDATAAP
jgi:hypothetical protein